MFFCDWDCDCCAWLDIRYVPADAKTVVAKLKRLIPKGFKLEIVALEPSLQVAASNPYLRSLKRADEKIRGRPVALYGAQGTSDARHYSRVGCAGVEFGPIGGGIGTDAEWVDIASLATYHRTLVAFLSSL